MKKILLLMFVLFLAGCGTNIDETEYKQYVREQSTNEKPIICMIEGDLRYYFYKGYCDDFIPLTPSYNSFSCLKFIDDEDLYYYNEENSEKITINGGKDKWYICNYK